MVKFTVSIIVAVIGMGHAYGAEQLPQLSNILLPGQPEQIGEEHKQSGSVTRRRTHSSGSNAEQPKMGLGLQGNDIESHRCYSFGCSRIDVQATAAYGQNPGLTINVNDTSDQADAIVMVDNPQVHRQMAMPAQPEARPMRAESPMSRCWNDRVKDILFSTCWVAVQVFSVELAMERMQSESDAVQLNYGQAAVKAGYNAALCFFAKGLYWGLQS